MLRQRHFWLCLSTAPPTDDVSTWALLEFRRSILSRAPLRRVHFTHQPTLFRVMRKSVQRAAKEPHCQYRTSARLLVFTKCQHQMNGLILQYATPITLARFVKPERGCHGARTVSRKRQASAYLTRSSCSLPRDVRVPRESIHLHKQTINTSFGFPLQPHPHVLQSTLNQIAQTT